MKPHRANVTLASALPHCGKSQAAGVEIRLRRRGRRSESTSTVDRRSRRRRHDRTRGLADKTRRHDSRRRAVRPDQTGDSRMGACLPRARANSHFSGRYNRSGSAANRLVSHEQTAQSGPHEDKRQSRGAWLRTYRQNSADHSRRTSVRSPTMNIGPRLFSRANREPCHGISERTR